MKNTILISALIALGMPALGQTVEECQQWAERNYPLIRQYGLIEKTTELTLANIQKGWLPQVSAHAQATWQSDVVSWPGQMKAVYQQMGIDMKGLRRDQYRVGIDISQTVYDGGAVSSQKAIAREQGQVQSAQTAVSLYAVRRRVNEMYFSLLMLVLKEQVDGTISKNEEARIELDGIMVELNAITGRTSRQSGSPSFSRPQAWSRSSVC